MPQSCSCSARGDYDVVGTPSETCLHGDRQVHRLNHLASDIEKERNVLQHASSGALACHFLHRATEIDVDEVGLCLFHYFCRFHHILNASSVDLYSYGTFLVADGQLVDGGFYRAHQSLGTDKLCIYH